MHRKYRLPLSGRPIPEMNNGTYQFPWTGMESFLNSRAISRNTANAYQTALRFLADWVQHYKHGGFKVTDAWPLDSKQLTTEIVRQFLNWIVSARSQATARTYVAAFRSFLTHLHSMDRLPIGIDLLKIQSHRHQQRLNQINVSESVTSLDEARQQMPKIACYYHKLPLPLKNDAYNRRLTLLRNRAFMSVIFYSAMRISEVVSLNVRTVGYGRHTQLAITGKGNKSRIVHLDAVAQQAIQAYLGEREGDSPALFISHSRRSYGRRLSLVAADNIVKTAVKALGCDPRLSAHDFRHFRATQLLRNEVPLVIVQEFLGHADISTTRAIYAPVIGADKVADMLRTSKGMLDYDE